MEEDYVMIPGSGTKMIIRDVKKEIETAFLDYSMSVIVARALPDVRDGLKPVHRRILYTMHERGNDPSHPYRKSADTVGAVLGSYHPHGDASVYDAMVRLAQDFSLRYPLVDGQGNFGSVDGDPPAAYRYTEARMSRMAVEMLTDIDKDTINWDPNFDETKKEPSVLPCRFPNLLVNGSQGIAVGMATNIPPHNLSEVIDGCVAYIENPDIDLPGLMEHIKGPDFPTAGIIMGRSGIRAAYATGRGKITLRGRAEIIEKKNGRYEILISEIPYMVNKAAMLEKILKLSEEKKGQLQNIYDIRDESDREGMRAVIELKKDVYPQVILNTLYKHTSMQETFGANMLALVNGQPKILSLRDMVYYYLEHQKDVVTRRTRFDLNKALARAHILEGLLKALDHIDEIVSIIRASKDPNTAKTTLMERFDFSDKQAQAILDMRLARLTGLERDRLQQEYDDLEKEIARFQAILADEHLLMEVIKTEISAIRDKFADPRRTELTTIDGEIDVEDLIQEEDMVVTLTRQGYVKRTPKSIYRAQNRGGRGVQGMTQKDDDFTEELFVGSTHDYMLFMTNQGRVYRLKGYQVPEGSRTAKGSHIVNLLQLQEGEKVTLMLQQKAGVDEDNTYATMVTKHGLIKRTPLSQFRNIRKMGLIAIALNEGDSLVWSHLTKGDDEIIVATHDGAAIRFTEDGARSMGRTGHGVRVIKLREGDYVVGAGVCRPGANVLTISEEGKGRRSRIDDYRITKRGGLGIRNYSNGNVAGIKIVDDTDDLILISQNGILIRIHAADINVQSRYGSGVRVMRLVEDDKVAVVARVDRDNDAETAKIEDTGETDPTPEELAAIEAEELAQEAAEDAAPENETEE